MESTDGNGCPETLIDPEKIKWCIGLHVRQPPLKTARAAYQVLLGEPFTCLADHFGFGPQHARSPPFHNAFLITKLHDPDCCYIHEGI